LLQSAESAESMPQIKKTDAIVPQAGKIPRSLVFRTIIVPRTNFTPHFDADSFVHPDYSKINY
jgi:hypothetical protein